MQEEKQFISPIKQRILFFAATLGISKREFYAKIGVSRGTLESKTGITEDVLAKFIATYPNISPAWLLMGEEPMLKQTVQNQNDSARITENSLISSDKYRQNSYINQEETSYIYKMYKDEKEENKALIEEIGGLKERIRQLEYQGKESEPQSRVNEVLETFTSESSGNYGEDYLPTKQPTISKRLSGGKTL